MSDSRVLLLAVVAGGLAYWSGRIVQGQAGEGRAVVEFDPAPRHLGATLAGNLSLSPAGLAFIQRHEGLRLEPYQDAAGHWTIGYGHKMEPGEEREAITAADAARLLLQDTDTAARAVRAGVLVPISQGQFDALVSLAYNIGAAAFRHSTLLTRLNAGDYAGAADEFHRWKYAGGRVLAGLVQRRAEEAELFTTA